MAVKAIRYGITVMPTDSKDAVVEYARAGEFFKFLVRRTKSGFSVTSEHKSEKPKMDFKLQNPSWVEVKQAYGTRYFLEHTSLVIEVYSDGCLIEFWGPDEVKARKPKPFETMKEAKAYAESLVT